MYLEAILLGLLLGVALGPVTIAMIELALQAGKKPAFSLASGVWLGDVSFVFMVFFGLSYISEIPGFNFYLGLFGGLVIILFGLMSIFSKTKRIEVEQIQAKSYVGFFVKGFAINFLNPFVYMFWISIIGNISENAEISSSKATYLALILGTVALSDFIKILVADYISSSMSEQQFRYMRIISGLGLVGFGVSLIFRVF